MVDRSKQMHLGDPFPLVPIAHFEKDNRISLRDAWQLVGPTIEKNQARHGLQALLCIAFIEGMRMALHVAKDK